LIDDPIKDVIGAGVDVSVVLAAGELGHFVSSAMKRGARTPVKSGGVALV